MRNIYNIYKKLLILLVILLNNYCYSKNIHYKIALVAPFSGMYSAYGQELLTSAQLAIKHLKNTNFTLELVPFDDQCNPDIAKSIATEITKKPEIKAVIGHACAATTMLASKIYAKHGLLHLIPTTCPSKITEQPIITLFRLCGTDDKEAQNISNFIYKNFNNKKIAILHSQILHNQELINNIQEYLAVLKIYPTLYQSVNLEQLNNVVKIKAILKKLQKLDIDIVIFDGLHKEAINLITTMHKNNIKIPLIISSNTVTKQFLRSLDNNIAVGTMVSFQKLDTPNLNKINLAIFGYTAIQIVNAALQNNSNYNPRILANWLHQHKVSTILGDKSWDTNGNIIDDEFAMYMINSNGQYSIIN